jgi:RNA polymerase sigma-70 factor (ECF subfamily)
MAAEPRITSARGLPSTNGRSPYAPAVRNGEARASEPVSYGPIGLAGLDADCDWLRATMERFEGPLVRYAMRITGNLERGRDVVQETFLRLCREPPVAQSDHVAQWLFTVCRRLAIDVRRKETRMNTQLESAAVCDDPARAPSSRMEQSDDFGQVLRLFDTLPANQQEVVRLKFQEEMSYKEIAAITGLSVSNVGYLLHMAVQSLRAKLKASHEE